MNFDTLTDNELIDSIHSGNPDAMEYLIKKYSPLVRKSIRTLYLIGADTEDLSQEGMIGLFKAIQSYKKEQSASFFTYARLCIERQIYTAIKASNRQKHSPLNSYISLYNHADEEESSLIDNLEAGTDSNPEHIILDREKATHMEDLLRQHLSPMEQRVLHLYLEGQSYNSISETIGKPVKSVNNAVCRIRDKMKQIFME